MANIRSPYKEVGMDAHFIVGDKSIKKKKAAYPNRYFKSPEEYVDFAKRHHVFGKNAQLLKASLDKDIIPFPTLRPPNTKEQGLIRLARILIYLIILALIILIADLYIPKPNNYTSPVIMFEGHP